MYAMRAIMSSRSAVKTFPSVIPTKIGLRMLSSYPSHLVVGMPALSPTMETGTIEKWLCKSGDEISPGDAIAEIATDKAIMAFEAQDDFYVAKLLVPEGTEVKVGDPLFVSVEDKGDVGAFESFEVDLAPGAAPEAPASAVSAPVPAPPAEVTAPAPAPATTTAQSIPTPTPPAQAAVTTENVVPASAAPPGGMNVYAIRWGSSVAKAPLSKKLASMQGEYIAKYGRSAQKPL